MENFQGLGSSIGALQQHGAGNMTRNMTKQEKNKTRTTTYKCFKFIDDIKQGMGSYKMI